MPTGATQQSRVSISQERAAAKLLLVLNTTWSRHRGVASCPTTVTHRICSTKRCASLGRKIEAAAAGAQNCDDAGLLLAARDHPNDGLIVKRCLPGGLQVEGSRFRNRLASLMSVGDGYLRCGGG